MQSLQEWIGSALRPDSCSGAVTGDDDDLVGKGEETVVDGGQNLAGVAAREVGATDGAGEEGVSG